MSSQAVTVKQIASRLENATSLERMDALQELVQIAKQSPEVVGEHALKKVLDFLKEQGSSEEYQEALDLIFRLVKCRDKSVAEKNTAIVLGDARSVELLLELLEHEDWMVGVQTSQILTELHANDGAALESQIQMCPDGMNKLLQRLPDTSREEVRNQAIVLIQQLTANNEEMKKTVVFNEGFEILFNIIRSEGGANDAGLVTQDCLAIANNILHDSETCQRLFFGMGVDWILRLADFFDPTVLESKFATGGDEGSSSWYDQPTRLSCAILALSALYGSLSVLDKKHQVKIVKSTSSVIPSAAFWVARKGPLQLVNAALSLLYRAVDANPEIAEKLCNELVKFSPPLVGKNIPFGAEATGLQFSWRPSHEDDRRMISLPALLVERYIFPTEAWLVEDGLSLNAKLSFECTASGESDAFALSCLRVFEKILSAGTDTSDLLVQFILAPPPPDADNMTGKPLESMTPLGTQVLNVLVEACQKVVGSSTNQQFGGMTVSSAYFKDLMAAERAANVFSLVFINGSSLAKEFATAIRDEHTSLRATGGGHGHAKAMPLLPILLATAGRTARIPNGGGYTLLVALLRMLATIVSGCEAATKQMLEDPANLFVVELATAAGESAGIPSLVQVAACFFLGCCFEAFSDPQPTEGQSQPPQAQDGAMNKSTFLNMIDKRIGLNRFTEILKKPLLTSRGGTPNEFVSLFFSPSFKTFYESQVESIRKGIFSFYAGVTAGHDGKIDAAMQQMLDMQNARIKELEDKLASAKASSSHAGGSAGAVVDSEEATRLAEEIEALKRDLSSSHHDKDKLSSELSAMAAALHEHSEAYDKLSAEKVSAEAALAEQIKLYQEAQAKVEEQSELMDIYKQSANEGKERAVSAEQQCESLRRELKQLQAAQQGDNQALTASMEESNKQIRGLEEQNGQLQKQLSTAQAKLTTNNEELASLRQLLHAGSDEKLKLLDELASRDQQIQSLRDSQSSALSNVAAQSSIEQQESWEKMVQTVTQLVLNLGVEVPDFESIVLMLQNAETPSVEKSKWLEYLLNTISFAVFTTVGQCSEVVVSAGAPALSQREGTVQRMLECSHLLFSVVQTLRSEKASLDAKIHSLSQELIETQQKLTAAESDQGEKSSLDAQLRELRQELSDAQNKLSAAVSDNQVMLASHQTETSALEAKIQTLNQSVSETQQKLSAVLSENQELLALQESHRQAQTTESSAQIDQLTRSNHELAMRINALAEAEKHLKGELSEKSELVAELQAQVVKSTAEIQSLSQKLKEANENVASLQQVIDTNHLSFSNETNLLRSSLKTATDNVAALESQLESAKSSSSAESNSLSGKVKSLTEQLATVQSDLDNASAALSSEKLKLISSQKDLSELNEKYIKLESDLKTKSQEIESLNASISELQRVNQTLDSTVQHLKNDKSKETIAELEEEKGSLLQKVTLLHQELAASTTSMKDLTQANKALEASLQQAKAESAEQLNSIKQEKDVEIEKLSVKLNEAASKVAEKDRAIQSLESSIAQMKSDHSHASNQSLTELERLRSQLSALQTETSDKLMKEADQFNQQVEQVKRDKDQAISKLQKQVHELNDRLTISDGANSKLVAENHALIGKNDSTLQKVVTLEKELAEGRSFLETVKSELETARVNLKSAEEKHQRAIELKQQSLDEATRKTESALAEKTAQIESLRKQVQISELATGELLEQQSAMEMKIKECDSHKSHAVELQKQINVLNTTITDLKSKALHESKSVNEALNTAKARERELESELDQLRRQHEQLVQDGSKSRLETQRANQLLEETEESLSVVQARCVSLEDQLSKNKVVVYNATKEADDLRKELLLKANDVRMLKDSFEAEKLRIEERHKAVALMDPFRAQDHEMRRLADACTQLTKDVSQKDSKLQELHQKLLHKEGELAGMVVAEEALKYDMEVLRRENESLTNKRVIDGRQLRELKKDVESLHDELDNAKQEIASLNSQIAKDKFRYQSVDKNSELLEKVEARLREVLSWIVDTLDLSAYTERVYSREYAYSCLELVDLIRACVDKVVGRLNSDLESHVNKIAEKERKLQEIQRGTSSLHLLESSLITPAKKPRTNGLSGDSNTGSSGLVTPPSHTGGELTLIKSGLKRPSVSPSAKEAARLNAEILREKRKFSTLSEQHSDLLGLLAQQEVELNVFRQALESKFSASEVEKVEAIAQKSVIDLYGEYTNFRQNSDPDEDFEIGEQLKAINL